MNLKTWFLETRPPFLILSIALVFFGTCVAWYDGYLHIGHAVLALIGLVLCHISVNVLNDYYDYKSGLDLKTRRTPFSGGSGILPNGSLEPKSVFRFGLVCFILAVPIGIYFIVVKGWLLLPLLLVGALCILLYTPIITRRRWPEWAPGAGLGILPVLGAYFVQTGEYTWPAIIAAVPSGILVHNLLLLNEFPDAEADQGVGKKTVPVTMGKSRAAIFYSALTVLVYIWIVVWAILRIMPLFSLIALLTLPFAIKAIRGSFKYQEMGNLIPAMANNVLIVQLVQFLLGIGYILAIFCCR